MTHTIERLQKRFNKLHELLSENPHYTELLELGHAINTLERFADSDPAKAPVTRLKPRVTRVRNGKCKAVNDATRDALAKHNRPVTREEIFAEVKKYGFTKHDLAAGVAAYISNYRKFKFYRDSGYWYADRPLPSNPFTALKAG